MFKQAAWIIAIIVILVAALTGPPAPAVAQGGGLTLQLNVGFDGTCHSGDWCPAHAIISNEGADVEGELRVAVAEASSRATPGVYARPVVLPGHSRKAYDILLPPADATSRHGPVVQLVSQGKALASQEAAVTWLRDEDRLYGVASSSPSALNFLGDVAPAAGRAAVAQLNLEALPPDPLGWEGLDVLVLTDVDTTVLSDEQRRALETWVIHGGHLVVGGGPGAARTVAGVADLLPVTVEATRFVDDLTALGERWGVPVARGPYAVSEVALREGEILLEQEQEQGDGQRDLVLLARRAHGAGTVDFLAFDAGLNPFARWDDNWRLWDLIVQADSATVPRLVVRNGDSAHNAVSNIPGLKPPSMLQILVFMLAYTLLIGPVNYFVLHKLDRRELAWVTIPALIVGFTACAYLTGFQIRGATTIVHRLAAVYVPQGGVVGRVSAAVGLFSPRRTTYDVRLAGAGAREMPGDGSAGDLARPPYFVAQPDGLTLTGLRVDVGGIGSFVSEGYADVATVDADLRLVTSSSGHVRMAGTIRNGGPALKEAVLIAGDQEQRLGDVEAGGHVDVDLGYNYNPGQTDTAEQILGQSLLGPDLEWQRRRLFLRALSPSGGKLDLGDGVYLVGWAQEAPLPVEVLERSFSTVETALYVVALPVAGLEAGATVVVPPNLITREVAESAGEVDVWRGGFHMEPESLIVFRFTVQPEVTVGRVDELVLELNGTSHDNPFRPLTVSAWDEERSRWDKLDVGWGRYSIPDAGPYVSTQGDVLVKLETVAGWPADVDDLTITIKGQR